MEPPEPRPDESQHRMKLDLPWLAGAFLVLLGFGLEGRWRLLVLGPGLAVVGAAVLRPTLDRRGVLERQLPGGRRRAVIRWVLGGLLVLLGASLLAWGALA